MGQVFHWANLALAFVLELCSLAALGYWGVSVGGGLVTKTALELGALLFAAVLWGLFAAPRAPVSAPLVGPGVKLIVFGSGSRSLVRYRPLRHRLRQRRPGATRTVRRTRVGKTTSSSAARGG